MKNVILGVVMCTTLMIPGAYATTVYCSTVTCGDYDEAHSAGFCDSSFKWCNTGFQDDFGDPTYYSEYKYCMPYGGYYLYNADDTTNGYTADHQVVCYKDKATCDQVRSLSVPFVDYGGYMHPESGYFISCPLSKRGSTSSTDNDDNIYACPPGAYSARGVRARSSDGVTSLACRACAAGTYSDGVAYECETCPQATDIYTNSTLTTLAQGTSKGYTGSPVDKQGAKSINECYLPIGTYYDKSGSFDVGSNMCTY